MKSIARKSWFVIAGIAAVVAAAYAASNPKTREPKCESEEKDECLEDIPPSADGVTAVADCDGFYFSISNMVDAVEKWHTVIHWTGDGDCMEDSEKSKDENSVVPDVSWTATIGGETITGSGTSATLEPGTNDTASCTFVMTATMPKCGHKTTASVSGSATFENEVTINGGGDICCTSSSHPSHRATYTVECGDVSFESDDGLSASANNGIAWVSGGKPCLGAELTAKARGGSATATYNVYDVGELELTGGCGCVPDHTETMEGFAISGIQHLLPLGTGSTKNEGKTVKGWFDCNGNGECDGDEPQTSKGYTVVSLGSLSIASANDSGGEKDETFSPGTVLVVTAVGANPAGGLSLSIGDMESKEKNKTMNIGAPVSNGADSWTLEIPANCPAGTFTIEASRPPHTCKTIKETITVAGCSCATCEQNGDMTSENGCIDISFGLGRTETGGAKSRIHIRLDDPSITPEIASRTFPDGRMESFVTNGVRHLEFYETTNDTPHVSYELAPGESVFTVLENRNGTPRRFTQWIKSGDEWIMEIYDPTVSPMELVERVAKTETTTSNGKIVRETDGIIAIEQEYSSLSNGDMFLVRETRGTGANAQTTWHVPVESGDGAGQTRSTVNADGSWIMYTYDSEGRVLTETEPFGDTAPILDSNHSVTGCDGAARVTEYIYSSVDNRDDGTLSQFTPRTTITRIGSDSLGWTETSRRYHAEFLEADSNNTTQRVAITERAATPGAAYGASDSLRSTTYYNWRNANAGRPNLRIAADGLATFYCYEFAVTNTAAGTITNRVTESFTAPLSATNGIPYKTTVSRTISNLKGDVSREETWLVVEEGRELLSWTDYERDSAGRILRKESSNGDVEEAEWGCCGQDWTLDARGVLTEYSYDASKRRVSSSCGTVTTLWTYDLSGNVTNVTRYGISGVGAALVSSSSSGYDNAGRPVWTIGEDGVRTEYSYGISPEGGEIRTTIQGAGTDSAVTNTTVSYRDGATKATYLNGVLKSTEIREPFAATIYEGTNGVDSVRWSRCETDFLGRTVCEERPGFGGSTLVTSNNYDSAGRLISTHSSSLTPHPSSPNLRVSAPLRETIYLYNELGDRVATIDDRNFDGVIDWAGADLVSSNDTCYVAIDDTYWREMATYSVHDDNSAEARLTGIRRTRMTGLGEDGLASESVSIDQRGNATTNRVWRYRDDALEISETKYPTSQIAALSVVSNNLAIMSVSQTGVTNTFSYDALNRQIATIDGRGNTTQTVYDEHGRIASTIDALGYATTYGYDALGRQTSVTDPLTNTVTTAYDAEGRVISLRGATYPVDYAYNEFGEKIAMTTYRDLNSSGDTTRWLLDEATGLVTNKVYADGIGPTYTYTSDGKLATRTWARGIVTTYSYDSSGSLMNTVYSDGTPTISLAYDRAGRQIQAIDAAGLTTFAYDVFGALTNETVIGVAGTNTIERYYDGFGRSTGYSLNGIRQTTLAYDPATGRISSMLSDGGNTPFEWSYLPGSDLKSSLAYPNGLTASWQYDANGQLLQVKNAFPTNIVSQYDYTYDAAGRRTERYHSGSAFATPDQIYYDYNERSELTNAVASVDASYNFAYNYDDIGNRQWSIEHTNEVEYTANNLNQYTAIEEDADTFVPQFDADGNQTLIKTATGIWQVTYNGGNRPIYWSNGITNIVMKFDRMGRRVQYLEKTGSSTNANKTFTYDNYLCIARNREQDNGTIETDRFTWNPTEPTATRPLLFNYSTAPQAYYTHDGNKNVSELVDGNEAIVAHYEYEAFGAIRKSDGAGYNINPYQFSSECKDDVLDSVYFNYRHYNYLDGRWFVRDEFSNFLTEREKNNLYCFTLNEPISKLDLTGRNIYIKNRSQHQSICVDKWRLKPEFDKCPDCHKQERYDKAGTFCIEFAWVFPLVDINLGSNKWLNWNSYVLPTGLQLTGMVIPDEESENSGRIGPCKKTTPCQDVAFMGEMAKMLGKKALYSIGRHNCRMFAQLMFKDAPGTPIED